MSKSVFGYFKTKKKKVPTAIKLEGRGMVKPLMARSLRKKFFCGFPIMGNGDAFPARIIISQL